MNEQMTLDDLNALIAAGKLKSMTMTAVVTRANGDIEPQGIIAGYHRNIFKHIALRIKIIRDRIRTMRKDTWPQF